MIKRHLESIAFAPVFGRQMRFVVGPRQSGKTTLAKTWLTSQHCSQFYFNWDDRAVRDQYLDDSHFFARPLEAKSSRQGKPWLVFDEIHKYPKWKNVLKGAFDAHGETMGFVVTSSARMDMLRRAGDSLAGRYFIFRLNPLLLNEVQGAAYAAPPAQATDWVETGLDHIRAPEKALDDLLLFGGFPEPLLRAEPRFYHQWSRNYWERLIREDIRDLTRILDLENILSLLKLLPGRIGAPLSVNSLSRDLRCGYSVTAGYLKALELGYLVFKIRPYARRIARSITKETKMYFYDWTRAGQPASQFENFVAMELKTRCELWTDSGEADFDLRYVRTRDGRETDFLVVREGKPWLLAEVKMDAAPIEAHHFKHQAELGSDVALVQIVRKSGVAEKHGRLAWQVSASRLLSV